MNENYNQVLYQEEDPKAYIEDYWTKRSEGFASLRKNELHSDKYQRWEKEILTQLPTGDNLKILDIGCGAGFFSIILAKHGHQVVGIDLTESMIADAKILAAEEGVKPTFCTMDAENLDFDDESFDVVISRNLTWTLPHPRDAYREWMRVLKKDGVMLNYDAEYAKDQKTSKLSGRHAHDDISKELMNQCNKIYHMLDISEKHRPEWDRLILMQMEVSECEVNPNVGQDIYKEKDMFYIPVPMFRIRAVKRG